MYKYAVIFLICVNLCSSDPSCCEEQIRTKSYLEMATNMISKALLTVPTCNETKNCDETKICDETKTCNETKICDETKKCNETKVCDCDMVSADCSDLYKKGYNKSGVYTIRPASRLIKNKTLDVYCDMKTDGGGWTVIQRRGNFGNPDDFFYKGWKSYKNGFGGIDQDFWIGNDNIFALSNQKEYSIRFDLQEKGGKKTYANYESFWIDDEYNNYTIHITGYSGNADDAMTYHNSCKFTTKDKTNALSADNRNCAIKGQGAWWYKRCFEANLNGMYNKDTYGIFWKFSEALTSTEMKIRPKNFVMKDVAKNAEIVKRDSVDKSYLKKILFT